MTVDELTEFLIARGYKKIGKGNFRDTYTKNYKYVIKVPHSRDHENHTRHEAYVYKHIGRNESLPLAECKLISIWGRTCLKMEFVVIPDTIEIFDVESYPWINDIDSYQVGYNLKNELVAYDYGYYFIDTHSSPDVYTKEGTLS